MSQGEKYNSKIKDLGPLYIRAAKITVIKANPPSFPEYLKEKDNFILAPEGFQALDYPRMDRITRFG